MYMRNVNVKFEMMIPNRKWKMIRTARNGLNAKSLKRKQFFPKKTQESPAISTWSHFFHGLEREKKTCQRRQFWSKNFHPETTCNYLHICNRIADIRVPKNIGFPKILRKTILMWLTGTCNLRTVSKEGMADVFKDFGRLWDYWDHPSFEFMGCFPFR